MLTDRGWTQGRRALDALKVEPIDHGVQAMKDPPLVARLVRDKVPLTV